MQRFYCPCSYLQVKTAPFLSTPQKPFFHSVGTPQADTQLYFHGACRPLTLCFTAQSSIVSPPQHPFPMSGPQSHSPTAHRARGPQPSAKPPLQTCSRPLQRSKPLWGENQLQDRLMRVYKVQPPPSVWDNSEGQPSLSTPCEISRGY